MTPPLARFSAPKKKEKKKKKKENKRKKRKKKKKKGKKKENKQRNKRRVPRRAISAGHRVQEHNSSCYKWARRGEEKKLPSLLYGPLSACSNGSRARNNGYARVACVHS
jgi:hypothetical protein